MLTLLSEVKFLTARDDINIKDTDFGAFKYQDKKISSTVQPYAEAKQSYVDLRSQPCSLEGKNKSKKILNSIKKLEEQLKHNKIVYCAWSDNVVIQLLLSNGLLVHICVNIFTGDIIRMAFDRFFVGKLISDAITDAIITRMHIILSYNENQLTFVYLQKPTMKRSAPEKIGRMDPKIFNILINGPQQRKIARQLACNNSYDLIVVWTKSSQNEVYPWRPTVRDQDRANVHIYRLTRTKLDLLCYYWTENDPINIEFSRMNQNQLRSVEQKISRKGDVTIEICVYDIIKSKIQRVAVTSIPLQTQVCCHSFSPDNEKLMLGCIDGSVVLFDEGRGITHLIKAAFIPTLVTWHADSAIVIIANERSQIQSFDISLACIKSQLISEDMTPSNVLDLSSYFGAQPTLLNICCSKKPDLALHSEKYVQTDSFVLLLFENGPMANLRLFGGSGLRGDIHTSGFTADVIIHQYLSLHNVERAINVLLCLNWDTYGAMCLISLNKIANYIFKQALSLEREMQLEKALGSFHVPVKPLCKETEVEFGDQVRDITRKFFQYLLRYKSYEKAFNLAIDIKDEDLFMDLCNCAKTDGQIDLAEDAFRKAEEILTRSDSRQSSHSTCSRPSCSECGDDSSIDESEGWNESNELPDDAARHDTKTRKSATMQNRSPEDASTSSGSRSGVFRHGESDANHNTLPPHSFVSTSASNLPKTRFNIPKPELKVSSQPRTFRQFGTKSPLGPSNERIDAHMIPPLPIFSKTASQIDLMRDYSTLYSSSSQSNAARPASMFPSSFSTDQVDHMGNHDMDYLRYQTQTIDKVPRPLPRVPQQQQHKVIDIVPKPPIRQTSNVPEQRQQQQQPFLERFEPISERFLIPGLDQTLGIPVISPSSSMNHLHAMGPPPSTSASTLGRPIFNYAMHHPPAPMPLMPMHGPSSMVFNSKPQPLLKSKSMYNITANMPQVIHQHPLVSGHIPPTTHFVDSYTLKRNTTTTNLAGPSKLNHRPVNLNAPSILSSPSTQPTVSPKKENGEKNKVKFSDTVTVAVVPEIPRKDKSLMDRIKRQPNGYHHPLVTDPKRELADSLPLCHPNDEYLKDFQPMSSREDQQSNASTIQDGVLTWV